jgi:hypothetical protein
MILDFEVGKIALALLVGAGSAGWVTHRNLTRAFDQKLRRIVEMQRKQHEAIVDKLSAAHEAAKKELDYQISARPRQQSVLVAEQRSAVIRLEEQLKSAYAELDTLRLQVMGPAPEHRPSPQLGFADTQPFESNKKAIRR